MTTTLIEEELIRHGIDSTPDREYFLTEHEAQEVRAVAADCAWRYSGATDERFVAEVGVIAHDLPAGLRRAVLANRYADDSRTFTIHGSRVDDGLLERTPAHWRTADTPGSRIYGTVLTLYAALFGDVVGWQTQQDGRVITDVLPIAGHEQSLISSCSERELAWHTEDAFSPYRADWVGLLALRNPRRTPTTISYVDPAQVPDGIAKTLSQRRFVLVPDDSHVLADRATPAVSLLAGHPGQPTLRVDKDYVRAVEGDADAEAALRWLTEHLDRNIYPIYLAQGDACFIDNRSVVHGRGGFQPHYDGTDRWLKRVNVVVDLRRTRPVRRSAAARVLRTDSDSRWGQGEETDRDG
jgi:alpha-ketoglutarate-dependent taurine dioxygenase